MITFIKISSLLFLLSLHLYAKSFSVASYNVENLFDLKVDGTEYKAYEPNKRSQWNHKMYQIKLDHLTKVLKALNADIIALQEVESKQAFEALKKRVNYPYGHFAKNNKAAVGLGLLSRYEITKRKKIAVASTINRPIQQIDLRINDKKLIIFNNHWPSKRQAESFRITYAMKLKETLSTLPRTQDYLIVGDLNSNYNEADTFKFDTRLNDTFNYTGINDVLKTRIEKQAVTIKTVQNSHKALHFNPWQELNKKSRFSAFFRGRKMTPDHILMPKALFDQQAISYINNSFKVFKPSYLYKNKKINRWQIKKGVHQKKGYSDHLPLIASFESKPYTEKLRPVVNALESLYHDAPLPKRVYGAVVLYVHKNKAIIKKQGDRAILIYNKTLKLKEGDLIDLRVLKLKSFHGLKEINELDQVQIRLKQQAVEKLYLNAKNLDLHDERYQNEIITNLQGLYKNGYLYTNDLKIRIYAKDKELLPKNGENITIIRAHLGFYNNQAQINIYKQSDIKVSP